MKTSIVARLRMIRKNLPRSWVSALSVRHHSKSDTCSFSVEKDLKGVLIDKDVCIL